MNNNKKLQDFCKQHANSSGYGVEMSGKEFTDGFLSDFSLEASNLQNSIFEKCVFNQINFYDCQMSLAAFHECVFIDCDFSTSQVFKTEFEGCIFLNSKFIKWDLLSTVLNRCTFISCDFKLADFGSANFSNSRIVLARNLNVDIVEGVLIQ